MKIIKQEGILFVECQPPAVQSNLGGGGVGVGWELGEGALSVPFC